MPRATCRCGQSLTVPENGSGRTVCPSCGAKVRIRPPKSSGETPNDGYLRFFCPCGRRLKVPADAPPSHGKCPDCGTVVPVPSQSLASAGRVGPEVRTDELSTVDQEMLDRWSRYHMKKATEEGIIPSTTDMVIKDVAPGVHERIEAGLRVCPGCGRPVHLGADVCGQCGIPVPRR